MKKKPKLAKVELFERFVHVEKPRGAGQPLRVQAVREDGKLVTCKANSDIYDRVLGTRKGENGERFHLGLRQLTQVKFRAHFDEDEVLQAIDIIPNRSFVSGAAPRVAGDNRKRGFDIHEDEELNGFDVWSEDQRTGDKVRVSYAGLDENELCNLLDALRAATWAPSKRVQNLLNHRFERIEEGVYRCRPLVDTPYVT